MALKKQCLIFFVMKKENNAQTIAQELDVKLNRFSKTLIIIGLLFIALSFVAP